MYLSPHTVPAIQEVDVGANLRRCRNERSLSLRALAQRSGLSVNTLSMIENGKTSPSVSTLQRVATALRVPITAFFEDPAASQSVSFCRAGEASLIRFSQGQLADLGAGMAFAPLHPLLVSLDCHRGPEPEPLVHTGYEFVYCLTGQIGYRVGDENYLLNPGDSLFFEAHIPHFWMNPADKPAQAIMVLCPADALDRLGETHFRPAEE
jgi:transcriptional regulator with XRE-family HTH domain